MMELVDMRDLGSREAIRVGSSPTTRTKTKAPAKAGVFVLVATGSFQCSAETAWISDSNAMVPGSISHPVAPELHRPGQQWTDRE